MKVRILSILLAAMLALSLLACGKNNTAHTKAGSEKSESAVVTEKSGEKESESGTEAERNSTEKKETTAETGTSGTKETAERSSEQTESTEQTESSEAESSESGEEENGAVLRVAAEGLQEVIDPVTADGADRESVIHALYTGLYTWGMDYRNQPEVQCALASDFPEFTENGLTAEISLKESAWSNGEPLTAADITRSFQAAYEKAAGTERESLFSCFACSEDGVLKIRENGTYGLIIELSGPCPYLAELLSKSVFMPQYGGEQPDGPVTNGPFCLAEKSESGLKCVKNPYYFEAEKVSLRELLFLPEEDSENQYAAYKRGELDVIGKPTAIAVSRFAQDDRLKTVRLYETTFLEWNTAAELFAGKTFIEASDMRQAISLLIDRNTLKSEVWGRQVKLAETYIPAGMTDGNSGVFEENRSFFDASAAGKGQTEEAIALLTNAGYSFTALGNGYYQIEPALTIPLLIEENSRAQRVAAWIAEDLSVLGIEVEIVSAYANAFHSMMSGEYTCALASIASQIDDPADMLAAFRSDRYEYSCYALRSGEDTADWSEYDALLDEAKTERNFDRRALLLKDAEDMLFLHNVVAPLCFGYDTYLTAEGVSGICEDPFGVRYYALASLN